MEKNPHLPAEIREFLDQWRIELGTQNIYREEEWRSLRSWIEMRERMDYWMTGLAGGVLAYALQSYDAGVVPHFRWLAPVSWGLLLGSVFSGIRGLRLMEGVALSQYMTAFGEGRTRRFAADLERHTLWRRHGIGRTGTKSPAEEAQLDALSAQLEEKMQSLYDSVEGFDSTGRDGIADLEPRAEAMAKWRTRLLLAGLLTLALLRLANLNG